MEEDQAKAGQAKNQAKSLQQPQTADLCMKQLQSLSAVCCSDCEQAKRRMLEIVIQLVLAIEKLLVTK